MQLKCNTILYIHHKGFKMEEKVTKRYNVIKKDKTIEFRMPMEDFKKLTKKIEEKKDKNVSSVLRKLVSGYLES